MNGQQCLQCRSMCYAPERYSVGEYFVHPTCLMVSPVQARHGDQPCRLAVGTRPIIVLMTDSARSARPNSTPPRSTSVNRPLGDLPGIERSVNNMLRRRSIDARSITRNCAWHTRNVSRHSCIPIYPFLPLQSFNSPEYYY